ncbi:ShlB/FhaC/HecB family hemolysin secretion/activation protein [Parendozoicomonas sp. Alg238-R29]|uniref:ShlB/FhaC/HecB family hemolysin secretion/activation protein n=1 Tax=Parendozoicomonas sp. Alg238-R29 TaxID=2993446 RepID=UPI00248E7EC2|nr:ShlB/FhaC/HecB family hemolysin secretion/activation protein [Parendozoicomonas sp. Alg238-R29]
MKRWFPYTSRVKGRISPAALICSYCMTSVLIAPGLLAQDAGELLRDSQLPKPPPVQSQKSGAASTNPPAKVECRPPFFKISQVDLVGVTLFSRHELEALKSIALGPSVCLADIERLAQTIDRFYLENGYLARTVIPEQDVVSGKIQLVVTESRLGKIDLTTPPEGVRFNLDKAYDVATSGQPDSGLLNIHELQDSMRSLSGTPGVSASAQLVPSLTVEGTDVVIRLEDTDLVSSTVLADNHGSRFVGQERLLGFMVLDGPFGLGYQFTGTAVKTEGSQTLALSGSLPVSHRGARFNASLSYLDYHLIDVETAGDGEALSGTVQLSLPNLLSKPLNSTDSLILSQSHLKDRVAGIESANKIVTAITARTQGFWYEGDTGGLYSYSASATVGDVDLSGNRGSLAQDTQTAKTNGRFLRVNGQFTYKRPVNDLFQLTLAARAQHSFDNLDSSQKMSLGGVRGIRAYPTGEASGDSAVLIRTELRRPLNPELSGFTFLDAGWLRLNSTPWAGWNTGSSVKNEYTLHGLGVGVDWLPTSQIKVGAMVSYQLGNNPGKDSHGNDSDGRSSDTRAWLELSMKF